MLKQINHFYEFGSVRLDANNRILFKDGKQVPLQPKVIETLLVLVKNAQTVVDKDALLNAVWRDAIVEEGGLKRNISLLRKALGEEGRLIETLPKRGYRFTAEVKESWEEIPAYPLQDAASELVLERTASLRIMREEEITDSSDPLAEVTLPDKNIQVTPLYQRMPISSLPRYTLPVLAVFIVALVAALGLLSVAGRPGGAAAAAPIRSLAVLPFKQLAGHASDEHLGIGIADLLITRLSNIKDLKVRPTSSIFGLNNKEQDSIASGQVLGVDAVLEGSIYRVGDRMRITARLVRVSDQSPVWAGQFDEKADDFLLMQNTIAHQVASSMALNLSRTESDALTKQYTENADAYQLYVTGRYHWNKRNGDGFAQSEVFFRKAIEKDPDFALAYLGLADNLTMRGVYIESFEAIRKAIELDDKLGEAYASRGLWRMFKGWQWGEAEADFKRAIELNPGYGSAHQWHATLLAITGQVEEAKAALRRALEIDPGSHNFLADMGQMHYFAREYAEAEDYCRKALEIEPDFGFALGNLNDIYLKRGERDKAFEEEMKALRANYNPFTDSEDKMAQHIERVKEGYRRSGYEWWWRLTIERLQDRNTDFFSYHALVKYYTLLGETEKALAALEKSYENHDFMLPFVYVDPLYDTLRSEPRFKEVFRRMGLAR